MLNTNNLLKDIAFDVISIITIWGVLNNSILQVNDKIYNISSVYKTVIGFGISTYILKKYM